MKILVFSDSHGAEQRMIDAVIENKGTEVIIFLGDGEKDFEEMMAACGIAPYGNSRSIRTFQVRGNCDWYSGEALTLTAELGGVRLLITHGHEQKVKYGLSMLAQEARKKECALALFGHTHSPYLEDHDGITLINPGSIKSGRYAIITIEDGEAECKLAFQG